MFAASHLLVIQFRRKYVTKCLNFSLTMSVLWHSPKYTCSIQCSSVNKNSIVDGFTHKQTSRNFNFTISALRCFTRSITRSWITSDEGAGDCRSCSMSVCLAINVSHVAWGRIRLPLLSPSSISTEDTDPTLIPMSRYLYVGVKANLLPNMRGIWRGFEWDVL